MKAKGDCFAAAARLAGCFGGNEEFAADPTTRVCHGIVTRYTDGLRHPHAWVERTSTVHHPEWPHPIVSVECFDRSNGHDVATLAALYYRAGGIDGDEVVRYTVDEAAVLMVRTGHFGPWQEIR